MAWDLDLVIELDVDPLLVAQFNCDCGNDEPRRTLVQVRRDLMIRLGFAAQVNNPPPGMALLLDTFIRDAQEQIHRSFRDRRIERFFRWPLVPGSRFYGLRASIDGCPVRLDRNRISWVGIQELNGTWYPLTHGIPPEAYSRALSNLGWPTRYEIRECVEIFPAPREELYLMIKGDYENQTLEDDGDYLTMDGHAVMLLALANAKAHYGRSDAANIFQQADTYLGKLMSQSHQTARYIPSPRGPLPAASRPRMTEFDA
jgi:hypothetical protein